MTTSGLAVATPAEEPARRLRVLVVEDNVICQRLVRGLLWHLGHEVVLAADGAEGLKAALFGDFDAVLMDICMPEMDGLEATRLLRASGGPRGRVPVVAVTSSGLGRERAACLAVGMSEVLAKPVSLQVLEQTLASVTAVHAGDELPKEETAFAPAERTSPSGLARERAIVDLNPMTAELLNHVPDPLLLLDARRQAVFANTAMLEATGCTPEELFGRRPGELLACKHATETAGGCGTTEACRQCGAVLAILQAQQGKKAEEECRLSVSRGDHDEALDLRVWASPLELGGQMFTFFGARDIADEKRKVFLEKIFLHDLMNTATALRGFAGLSSRSDESGHGRRVESLSSRLIDEIEGHRKLIAAERDELVARPRPLQSIAFLRGILETYDRADLLDGRRLALASDVADVDFDSDPGLLSRIVGNMTKNAIEASEPGETTTVGCRVEDGELAFWVHNPAVMPQAVRLQVFQRSFSTRGAGRGLGTYSMKYLTEKYLGGRVTFSSVEGAGTTFVARHPLRVKAPLVGVPRAPPRVVLADDSGVMRLLLTTALKRAGCEVLAQAANGQLAVEAVRTHRPEVVLLDVNMPVLSGEQALASIRAEAPEAFVMMLTGEEDATLMARCLASGATACLEKGRPLTQLVAEVIQTWNTSFPPRKEAP